jgi:hypothetical protein
MPKILMRLFPARGGRSIGRIVLDQLPSTLLVLSYLGLAILALRASLAPSEWSTWSWSIFVALLLAHLCGYVLQQTQVEQIVRLRAENVAFEKRFGREIDYYQTFDDYLESLSKAFRFDKRERMTVYKRQGDSFVILGRFASRPQFTERHRPIYHGDQGVIGGAWRDGWAFEACLPNPDGDLDRYLAEVQEKWKIPPEVTREFHLKARSLAAAVIMDQNRNRLAVLVIESERCGFLKVQLHKDLCIGICGVLAQLMHLMRPYEPNPDEAKQEGF